MTRASSVLGLAVLIAAAACGSDSQAPSGTSPYTALYQGLCQTHAEATHPDAARRTFFDRIHQSLHELAAETAASDRAAAARLLEAKEAVEPDFAGEPSCAPSRPGPAPRGHPAGDSSHREADTRAL